MNTLAEVTQHIIEDMERQLVIGRSDLDKYTKKLNENFAMNFAAWGEERFKADWNFHYLSEVIVPVKDLASDADGLRYYIESFINQYTTELLERRITSNYSGLKGLAFGWELECKQTALKMWSRYLRTLNRRQFGD